jgi:hypothetical protein
VGCAAATNVALLGIEMSESVAPIALPAIDGWPYQEITAEFAAFRSAAYIRGDGVVPGAMMVGLDLWCSLRRVSDSEVFFVFDTVPIQLDQLGILEPNEFMFVRKFID